MLYERSKGEHDAKVGDALRRLSEQLAPYAPYGTVALTAFRRRAEDAELSDDPLAAAWIELIGGGLERSESARRARRSAVAERNRTIRSLANKWERLTRS